MIDPDLFRLIFEMGYDQAKYNRQTKWFGTDRIDPLTERDVEDGLNFFESKFPDYHEMFIAEDGPAATPSLSGKVREADVAVNGNNPFERGTIYYTAEVKSGDIGEFNASIELLGFETSVETETGNISLEADFTDQK